MAGDQLSVSQLRVVTRADPTVLMLVLQQLLEDEVIPRRVLAECCTDGRLHVQVDVSGLSDGHLSSLVSRIEQFPAVLTAFWARA